MSDFLNRPECPHPPELIKAEIDRQALALLALKPKLEAYMELTRSLHIEVNQIEEQSPHCDIDDEWLDEDIIEVIQDANAILENMDGTLFNLLDDMNDAIRSLNHENQKYKITLIGEEQPAFYNLSKQETFNRDDNNLHFVEFDEENTTPYSFSQKSS